jgi:hypothetical protein
MWGMENQDCFMMGNFYIMRKRVSYGQPFHIDWSQHYRLKKNDDVLPERYRDFIQESGIFPSQ